MPYGKKILYVFSNCFYTLFNTYNILALLILFNSAIKSDRCFVDALYL